MAEYGPEQIAAARAVIANVQGACWERSISDEGFADAARDPETGWGAALDALEKTAEARDQWREEWESASDAMNAHFARAEAAEAEVSRLRARVEELTRGGGEG